MKHYLTIVLLFFLTGLFAQKDSDEFDCAANAGGDKIICYTGQMNLVAPFNAYYGTPPNIMWTYIGGELPVDQVKIEFDDQYNTPVINASGMPTWPVGEYYFQFCVDCKSSGGQVPDRPCDTMKVTVKTDPTKAEIKPIGDMVGDRLYGCHEVYVEINSLDLAPDEEYSVTTDPFSNDLFVIDDHNGHVTVRGNDFYYNCDFDIVYVISNHGCISTVRQPAHIVNPYDPNRDGIIEGTVDKCPSCERKLNLWGHHPGCNGKGTWKIIDAPPGANPVFSNVYPSTGDAVVEVNAVGNYTFVYDVTNIFPCPDSHDTIRCSVLDIDSLGLGADRVVSFCNDTLYHGQYTECFNYTPNTLYTWTTNNSNVTATPSPYNPACAIIDVKDDVDLGGWYVQVKVKSVRYFINPTCNDSIPYQLLHLPLLHVGETEGEIDSFLLVHHICFRKCVDEASVYYVGSPKIKVKKSDVFFLCSQGNESVRLADYFSVTNGVGYNAYATLVSQNPHCVNMPNSVSAFQLTPLDVSQCGGCGEFTFKIDVTVSFYDAVYIHTPCKKTIYITVHIETAHPVTAGTDQVKCPGDEIRLNGSDEYCGAFGTWTRINCTSNNYYNVVINDIHDHNTELFVTAPPGDTICPPDTLCFVWSYLSDGGDCDLSDTTRVIIRDSCCNMPHVDCVRGLHVVQKCQEGSILLTLLDDQNQPVDPSEYTIHWTPMNINGNPVTVNGPGPIFYNVEVYKLVGRDTFCYVKLSGSAKCDIIGCGAKIIESCAPNGDVILTLVDAVDNHIIVPSTYEDELTWTVYGGGSSDNTGFNISMQNPITIQQDACYSLRYDHWVYPDNAHFHAPGYQTEICRFDFPRTCVSLTCEGPCKDFNDFLLAGCGDLMDLSLGLTFPSNCQSVCTPPGQNGTLGVFQNSGTHAPISSTLFNITWKNNTHLTYVFGNLFEINTVTITSLDGRCVWKDGYKAECPCNTAPTNPHCEQPIVKHCYEDGTFDYTVGAPQIVWSGVPGATGYIVEVTTGSYEGCCNMPYSQVQIPVTTTYWNIPHTYQCFSVRVRAITPYCSETTAWSDPYLYCPQETTCSPVITVCGCCAGARSAEATSLPINIVPEDVLVAYLKEFPGTAYPTLNEALKAAGITASTEPEFKVFPNPASDRIIIQAGQSVTGTFEVRIYDLLQQQWRKETFEANGNNALNISDLPEGVYLISILNAHGDRMLAEKITVLRK